MRFRTGILGVIAAFALSLAAVPNAALARDLGLKVTMKTKGFKYNPVVLAVHVDGTKPNSEAAAAGFMKGDQIILFNGSTVVGSRMLVLGAKMKAVGDNDTMKFVVLRDGKKIPLTMVPLKKN